MGNPYSAQITRHKNGHSHAWFEISIHENEGAVSYVIWQYATNKFWKAMTRYVRAVMHARSRNKEIS
jgi:hypothetical protein